MTTPATTSPREPRLIVKRGTSVATAAKMLTGLLLHEDATLDAPNLERIEGAFYFSPRATINAPSLNFVQDLSVRSGETLELHALERIGGNLGIATDATLRAERLLGVDGNVNLLEGARITAGKLFEIQGRLDVTKRARMETNRLTRVESCLHLSRNAAVTLPGLERVGYLQLDDFSSLDASTLGGCGDIYAGEAVLLDAPRFVSADTIYIAPVAKVSLPALAIIHGDLALQAGAKFTALNLTSIVGDLSLAPKSELTTEAINPLDMLGSLNQAPDAQWHHGTPITPTPSRSARFSP